MTDSEKEKPEWTDPKVVEMDINDAFSISCAYGNEPSYGDAGCTPGRLATTCVVGWSV